MEEMTPESIIDDHWTKMAAAAEKSPTSDSRMRAAAGGAIGGALPFGSVLGGVGGHMGASDKSRKEDSALGGAAGATVGRLAGRALGAPFGLGVGPAPGLGGAIGGGLGAYYGHGESKEKGKEKKASADESSATKRIGGGALAGTAAGALGGAALGGMAAHGVNKYLKSPDWRESQRAVVQGLKAQGANTASYFTDVARGRKLTMKHGKKVMAGAGLASGALAGLGAGALAGGAYHKYKKRQQQKEASASVEKVASIYKEAMTQLEKHLLNRSLASKAPAKAVASTAKKGLTQVGQGIQQGYGQAALRQMRGLPAAAMKMASIYDEALGL